MVNNILDMSEKEKYVHVPYGMTVHGREEIDAVVKVLKTSTQMGKNVREFEAKVAKMFDKKHGIMVNSGSSALMLAMEVMNFPKGSEIITPVLTFSTTVSYIVRNGLVPVFIDVCEDTYCIDVTKIEGAITDKTKAILAPHLLGNIVNWEGLLPIIKKYNLKVIEDSADTLGGSINGKSIGRYSDISITSFYGSHLINCAGNGGMICLNDDEQARRVRLLRSWGRSSSLYLESEAIENRFNIKVDGISYDKKFIFEEIGHNLEPSEMGAAFGLVQLSKLQKNIDERIINFNAHNQFFKKYEHLFILPKQTENVRSGWLAYPLTIRSGAPFSREEMQIFLENRNIQTRVVFAGNITRQPGFKNIEMIKSKDGYKEADKVMEGGILIACHHGLNSEMLNHIHSSCELFINR